MSGAPLSAKIVQSKFRRFRANVVGATKDFMYVVPVLFPEGSDWDSLNASKIQLEEVEVEMKPYYNFCTLAGANKGVVSGDFPVYMNFYTGNTALELESYDMSKYILSGKYVVGSATTGVKARYGSLYYKTVIDKEPTANTTQDELKSSIVTKENSDNTIDNFLMENGKFILQKGRVVICLRKSDFIMDTDEVVTEENPTGESGSGNGAVLRHLRSKMHQPAAPAKAAVKEAPKRKAGRKHPGPEPEPEPEPTPVVDPNTYCEEPIVIDDGDGKSHEELIIDLPFWILTTFHIKYWRNS